MSSTAQQPISVKQPMNPVATYIMALAFMIACYSLYVKYAVPHIERTPQVVRQARVIPISELTPPQEEKAYLIPYLPQDAWELTDGNVLITDSGTIVFQTIETLEDGTLKVAPFTMVSGLSHLGHGSTNSSTIGQDDSKKERPIVMRAVQGAVLKFSKPITNFATANLENSKIKSARLLGDVDIYRPPSGPDKNDPLHVLTSNVHFDEKKIYTLDAVMFAMGPHRGRGRNLTLELETDRDQNLPDGMINQNEFGQIKGVRRMELAFLESIRVEPSESSNSMPIRMETGETKRKSFFSDNKSPIEISCKGAFVFDLKANTASFNDQVVATKIDPFRDNIRCDRLWLRFENEDGNSKPAQDANDDMSDLKLRQMVAEGQPAVITSRSAEAKVSGQRIEYDMLTSTVTGRSSTIKMPVTLVTPKHQLVTLELEYIAPEDDSIGPMKANGPGHLLGIGKDPDSEFYVRWNEGLETIPVENVPGYHRIILRGDSFARVGQDSNIHAEVLDLLMYEQTKPAVDKDGKPTTTTEFLPSKLVGTGSVRILSPKISGSAKSLTASWVQGTGPNSKNVLHRHGLIAPIHRTGYRGSPRQESRFVEQSAGFQEVAGNDQQTLRQVNLEQPLQENGREPKQKKQANKIVFQGNHVNVQLSGHGKHTQLESLDVDGNVRVKTIRESKGAEQKQPRSLVINGDFLKLIPRRLAEAPMNDPESENYRVMVSGSNGNLATVNSTDFKLFGQIVNLDQVANKIWVEGAGSMDIKPPKKVRAAQSVDLEGSEKKSMKRIENLEASWSGGMVFDGLKIYFERDVQMTAQQVDDKNGERLKTSSSSDGLSVELKQRLDLKQIEDSDDAPEMEIKELVFVDRVPATKQIFKFAKQSTASTTRKIVNVQTKTLDANGKVIEQQMISVPHLSIDADTGAISAKGPGTIATHVFDSGKKKNSNPFGRISGANKPKKKPGLTFVRVNFDGSLTANTNDNEMVVNGNIRSVYASVPTWETILDPDSAHSNYPESVRLNCESLQLAQWKKRSGDVASEMIATGNARMKSDRFQATADRVSYDDVSDVLTVEGTPRNDANLWIRQTPNDPDPTHLVAERITYRIADGMTKTDGIKALNINRK